MVKADMRKGMLLKGKIGAEERIYRVLDLKEKVLVLDCVKKTMPVWKTYEELSDYVEKEEERDETVNKRSGNIWLFVNIGYFFIFFVTCLLRELYDIINTSSLILHFKL